MRERQHLAERLRLAESSLGIQAGSLSVGRGTAALWIQIGEHLSVTVIVDRVPVMISDLDTCVNRRHHVRCAPVGG